MRKYKNSKVVSIVETTFLLEKIQYNRNKNDLQMVIFFIREIKFYIRKSIAKHKTFT